MIAKFFHLSKNPWFILSAGLIIGALAILTIRFFAYSPDHVHYHANFAVYINGQREEFKNPTYYEEVAMCTTEDITDPKQRVHMHEDINSVVHVHDHAVTWGQFFDNLGWVLGPDFIQNADGRLYVANGQAKLHVWLNGQDYTDLTSVNNMVVKDEDRLLVSYGDEDEAKLKDEFKSVPTTAHHYDVTADPASCSGHKVTPKDRFKHLFN